MPCRWGANNACQFATDEQALIDFAGRRYCRLHLPLESHQKQEPHVFAEELGTRIRDGARDFDGIIFPGTSARVSSAQYHVPAMTFRYATVGAGSYLVVNGDYGDFSHTTFRDGVTFQGGNFLCCDATCTGTFSFIGESRSTDVSFAKTRFLGPVTFRQIDSLNSLDLSDCHFARAPHIAAPNTVLPQATTINGASFDVCAEDEGAFRALRALFAANRARDAEGRVYACEKRSHRYTLTRPRERVPRAISFLYDWASEYGYSYGWPLVWFCLLQILAGFMYSVMSRRYALGGKFIGQFDGTVTAFTFAQIVKPFELFSSKTVNTDFYSIVPKADRGWWLALTSAQTIVSLSLIALFLLALRWRFRRE